MCAIEFDAAKYSKYISEEQWDTYSDAQKEQFKKMIDAAENATISQGLAGNKKSGNLKGVTVEKSDKTQGTSEIPLAENKELQKQKLAQYEKEFLAEYRNKANLQETRSDIIDVLYQKESKQIQAGLRKMAYVDPQSVLNQYMDVLNEDEKKRFQETYDKKLELYKKNP